MTRRQVLLIFDDTKDYPEHDQADQKLLHQLRDLARHTACQPLYMQSLTLNPWSFPVMICGIMAEGWTQCTRELRATQSDMEKMVQEFPHPNSWDLQKLFGHLSFRVPAMIAFRETLEMLKDCDSKFTAAHKDHGGNYLLNDLLDHQQGLMRSVKRDFDYMRGRLEDLSTLVCLTLSRFCYTLLCVWTLTTHTCTQSFNIIAAENSQATAEIAEQNFHDAVSMRTIALVTLCFLPGTFIAV